MELVTIIIPIYNKEKYLDDCLNSILSQTYDKIEVLCMDDCSIDESYNKCLRYSNIDNRIKVYKNDSNLGVSKTRNNGINLANKKLYEKELEMKNIYLLLMLMII